MLYSCSQDSRIEENEIYEIDKRHTYSVINDGFPLCKAPYLKVYIDDCFEDSFYDGIIPDVLQAYNDLGLIINFTTTESIEDADIIIECFESTGSCFGGNVVPEGIQTLIILNIANFYFRCCPGQSTPNLCQATSIVMHEIGHALGLGHTDNKDAKNIPGTVSSDPTSIYNSGSFVNWCNLPCEFADSDIEALEILYGTETDESPYEIDGPEEICVDTPTEYCLETGRLGVWPGNGPDELNCGEFSFSTPGEKTISVVIGNCTATKVINVITDATCNIPSYPPVEFERICMEQFQTCFDFSWLTCLESLEVTSSHPKLLVEAIGLEVCLSAIHHITFEASITITAIGICGTQFTVTYDLLINDPEACGEDF